MASQVINSIVADLDRFTAEQVIGLALDVNANLGIATPVDTGWARANWVANVGGPPPDVEQPKGRPTPAQVAGQQSVQQAALSKVLSYKLEDGAVFCSNGVPYILKLNDGWSKQAPRAFVQQVVTQTMLFSEHAPKQQVTARASFTYRPGDRG